MGLAVVAVLLLLVWLAMRRANELCTFELSEDGAELVRGRAPAELIAEVADVARRAAVPDAVVRVVTEGGAPRLIAPAHLGDAVVQQLRNVVGRHRVVHFRTGRSR
jgi:hypothetical protein